MKEMGIRKQVYEITPEDLNLHPIWEFAIDEEGEERQDEATVRPYESDLPLNACERMFIVRANIWLADGTHLCGYLTPPVNGEFDLGTIQPAVVVREGQVSFWYGIITPEPRQIEASYARLGKTSASEVFPLRFESDVELVGGTVAGELLGFIVIEDLATMKTRIIK